MPKHDEDMGGQTGLVRVDKTQRTIKKHVYSFKKHTFCQRACWSAACGTKIYKIKNVLISLKKLHRRVSEILRHRETSGNHTHQLIWSRWKPAAGGDHGVGVFFRCCLFCVFGCVVCTTWWLLILSLHLVLSLCLSVGYFLPFFFFLIGEVQSQIFYIHRFWY